MMSKKPKEFRTLVKKSLIRHAKIIKKHTDKGTYFFDYGNAFLLEASRAGADIMKNNGVEFIYPSYVQDIMGPMCFDYGFGLLDGFVLLVQKMIWSRLIKLLVRF